MDGHGRRQATKDVLIENATVADVRAESLNPLDAGADSFEFEPAEDETAGLLPPAVQQVGVGGRSQTGVDELDPTADISVEAGLLSPAIEAAPDAGRVAEADHDDWIPILGMSNGGVGPMQEGACDWDVFG